MNTKSNRWLLTLVLLATLTSQLIIAHAQGTAFTYQGRLNVGTNAATGIYDLRFGLWDALPGGTGNQQGNLLTNSATAVTNGLFTVTLDFGNQFPGALRWLEIGVRSNGVAAFSLLSPRQPLTPAPYAITAGNLAGTLPAAQLSGTINPANLPDGLGGSGNTAGGGDSTVAGGSSNTANGGGATVAGGEFNNAGGNLATVAGGAGNNAGGNFSFAAGHNAPATNDGSFVWADSQFGNFYSTTNDSFNVRAQGGARFVTSGAGLSVDGPVVASLLLVGKIGIGTNTPTENLTIANVTNFNSGLKLTGTNTGAIGMALENTSTGGHKFDLITTGTNSAAGAGAFVVFDETLHTNRLTVNSNGFVGIGTATPVTPLQVNGTVTATAFAGNGTSVTNVNAATLGGLGSAGFWTTNGNTGANPANGAYLGTADNYPLELRVNGQRAFRLENVNDGLDYSANVIGGYVSNSVASGVVGATIAGGGQLQGGQSWPNQVLAYEGTVGGGYRVKRSLPFPVFLSLSLCLFGCRNLQGIHLDTEGFVFRVLIGGNGFAHNFKETNEETARAAGRIANGITFLRFQHAYHELDNGARREELTNFAPERAAEKAFKGNAFHVFARFGKVVARQLFDDGFDRGGSEIDTLVFFKNLVRSIGLLGFIK